MVKVSFHTGLLLHPGGHLAARHRMSGVNETIQDTLEGSLMKIHLLFCQFYLLGVYSLVNVRFHTGVQLHPGGHLAAQRRMSEANETAQKTSVNLLMKIYLLFFQLYLLGVYSLVNLSFHTRVLLYPVGPLAAQCRMSEVNETVQNTLENALMKIHLLFFQHHLLEVYSLVNVRFHSGVLLHPVGHPAA